MALYKGSEIVAGLSKNTIVTGFNVFDFRWSDHLINDIQWLRSDTFSWQSGDVYVTAYNKLVEEWSNAGEWYGTVLPRKRTPNGFLITTPEYEQHAIDKYNSDGIAWVYILDIENKRFKLPRTKWGFKGLRNWTGDDVFESLPNIKGRVYEPNPTAGGFAAMNEGTPSNDGALYAYNTGKYFGKYSQPAGDTTMELRFDASRSSSTYQDNAPVQERATQMYLYFYVGEYSREAIEQTAGITSEQLNNKLDNTTRHIVEVSNKSLMPSWYRVYSDGWCEQGGRVPNMSSSSWASSTITLLKNFNSSIYYITTSPISRYTGSNYAVSTQISTGTQTNNGFTLQVFNGDIVDDHPTYWKASGYLAEGEY